MQLAEGVEWAVHCCVLLAALPPGRTLPAARLAEYHEVPPAYLAKHLQALSQAGIVAATAGRRGGYRLARPADQVTALDVVQAIEGRAPAFRCTEVRRRGPAPATGQALAAPCAIARVMWDAEAAWREVLAATTVQDLLQGVVRTVGPVTLRRSARWLEGAVR